MYSVWMVRINCKLKISFLVNKSSCKLKKKAQINIQFWYNIKKIDKFQWVSKKTKKNTKKVENDFLFLTGLIHIIYVNKIFFETKQAGIFLIRSFFSLLNNGKPCVVCGGYAFVYPVCRKCISKHFSLDDALNEKMKK